MSPSKTETVFTKIHHVFTTIERGVIIWVTPNQAIFFNKSINTLTKARYSLIVHCYSNVQFMDATKLINPASPWKVTAKSKLVS